MVKSSRNLSPHRSCTPFRGRISASEYLQASARTLDSARSQTRSGRDQAFADSCCSVWGTGIGWTGADFAGQKSARRPDFPLPVRSYGLWEFDAAPCVGPRAPVRRAAGKVISVRCGSSLIRRSAAVGEQPRLAPPVQKWRRRPRRLDAQALSSIGSFELPSPPERKSSLFAQHLGGSPANSAACVSMGSTEKAGRPLICKENVSSLILGLTFGLDGRLNGRAPEEMVHCESRGGTDELGQDEARNT